LLKNFENSNTSELHVKPQENIRKNQTTFY